MRYLVMFAYLILCFSCNRKNDLPEGILQPEKMQDVFWDYIKADVYISTFTKHDSARTEALENLKLQDRIFKLHHITKDQFYKSYTYYSNHKELMTMMMDSMTAKRQREFDRTKRKPVDKALE